LGATTSTHYRPEVDGLRAIAVLAVIAHHFWHDLLPGGFLGVDVFFVISGYVITTSISNQSHRFHPGTLHRLGPAELRVFTTPLIVLSTAALITMLQPKHPIFQLLTLRAVLLIGLMSYSLYLWHWSVLSISHWTIGVDPFTAPFQLGAILALGASSYFLSSAR